MAVTNVLMDTAAPRGSKLDPEVQDEIKALGPGLEDGEVTEDALAFHAVTRDKINPGAWFASKFAEKLDAEKVMIQKSGYYSRAAAANDADLALIKQCTDLAVDSALRGEPGVIGHDEENGDVLTAIAFDRIKGGKPFDITQDWYKALLDGIGQDFPAAAQAH